MRKIIFVSIISTAILVSGIVSLFMYANKAPLAKINNTEIITTETTAETEVVPAIKIDEPKVNAETRLTYKYYNADSTIKEYSQTTPYFLVGMDKSQISQNFVGWTLENFSPLEIVLKKTNSTSNENYYVLSVYNGYIAVYYDREKNHLKEVTSTPVSSLEFAEQERLYDGIEILGETELYKALESYGS